MIWRFSCKCLRFIEILAARKLGINSSNRGGLQTIPTLFQLSVSNIWSRDFTSFSDWTKAGKWNYRLWQKLFIPGIWYWIWTHTARAAAVCSGTWSIHIVSVNICYSLSVILISSCLGTIQTVHSSKDFNMHYRRVLLMCNIVAILKTAW